MQKQDLKFKNVVVTLLFHIKLKICLFIECTEIFI